MSKRPVQLLSEYSFYPLIFIYIILGVASNLEDYIASVCIVASLVFYIFHICVLASIIQSSQRLGGGRITSSYPKVLFTVGLNILLFGILYYALGRFEMGVVSNPGGTDGTLSECLYFSTITVTTLGYGDMVPQNLSRGFACLQVLTGPIVLLNAAASWIGVTASHGITAELPSSRTM